MDIPLEPAVDQKRGITADAKILSQSEIGDEVRFRIECYLSAWGFRDPRSLAEAVSQIARSVQSRVPAEPELSPTQIAIDETNKFLEIRLKKIFPDWIAREDRPVSIQERAALLFADLPETRDSQFPRLGSAWGLYQNAKTNFQLARAPQRPLEMHPIKMRTSLSHLPSFRLAAGWCVFTALLILIFILTH